MKTSRALLLITLTALALPVAARKPCDELQAEIDAKIRANGVAAFTLTVVAAADAEQSEGKVVGSCDGGEKRIVYLRGAATPAAEAREEAPAAEG
jgi:hypothetical protein